MTTTQLRIYTIQAGKLDAFVAAWQQGVYPLRHRFGFSIPHAWTIPAHNQFVWLLTFEGDEAAFADRNSAYYASDERIVMQPDPAQFIYKTEEKFLTPLSL